MQAEGRAFDSCKHRNFLPFVTFRLSFFGCWLVPGVDPELDLGGLNCLFHVKSFLALSFAIRNIAVWGTMAPGPMSPPLVVAPGTLASHRTEIFGTPN